MRSRLNYAASVVGTVSILALLVAGTALSLVLYDRAARKPVEESRQDETQKMLFMTGLGRPVTNKLSEGFADADGDLVADPPADASLFIDPAVLKFCYVVEEEKDFSTAFTDLLAAISKATGKPVEYETFESTTHQLQALRDGRLHVAGLGTGTIPVAVNSAGFVPLVALGGEQGLSNYQMEIIVPADSPLKSLSDLRDKELVCTEPSSNSGFKAALLALKQADLLPGRDYRIIYSNGHDKSIRGIASGEYKVAAVANDVLQREINAGTIKPSDFRSIYKSEVFPTACFGISHRLKPELAAKVREALLGFKLAGTSVEKEFSDSTKTQFVSVNFKNDWSLIRHIDEATGTVHELPKSLGSE